MTTRAIGAGLAVSLASVLAGAACEGCFYFPPPDAGPGDDAGIVPGDLVLNELMSSNRGTWIPGSAAYDDWIEVKNVTNAPLSLDGYRLADSGTEGTFVVGASIPAGGWLVVLANDAVTPGTPALPTFPFKLSAVNGDTISVIDPDGVVVDRVSFGAMGPDQAFGRLPDGDGAFVELDFASPGRANDDPGSEGEGEGEGEGECVPPFASAPPVFVNEVQANNTATTVDGEIASWIELHNASDAAVPLGGLTLADNQALDGAFALPAVDLAARSFLVVVADGDGNASGALPHTTPGFELTALDAEVVLADRCGTIWRTLTLSPPTPADQADGLLPDGDPAGAQVLTAPTPGAANQ